MSDFNFQGGTRATRANTRQGGTSSVWLAIIALLLLVQVLITARFFWFADYRLDRIDKGVREQKYYR